MAADTFNMSDVFLSYSRRDTEFCRKLFDSFKERGKEVWADFEDIPYTADWWQEIQAGINAADAFIFIISPDSARSEVCRQEVDHAISMNKRLIPILYREVTEDADRAKMHPSISSHNWLFFRETDDYDEAFAKLWDTLETDLDYNRTHTRLLVRAREWDENERGNSYLLQGEDLDEADTWLSHNIDKTPPPTNLHAEYVQESRRYAAARQRRFMIFVSVGFMVSVILAGFAILQWNDANIAREDAEMARVAAEKSAIEARSLALAANSGDALNDGNPDLALRLALESVNLSNKIPESRRALSDAAYSPGTMSFVGQHGAIIWAVAFSPDGESVITGTSDGKSCIWSRSSGELRLCLGDDEQAHTDDVLQVGYSRDGNFAVTASADGMLRVWDTNSLSDRYGQEMAVFEYEYAITSFAIHPRAPKILVGTDFGLIFEWDFERDTARQFQRGHVGRVTSLLYMPNGRRAVSGGQYGHVLVWNIERGRWDRVLDYHRSSVMALDTDSTTRRLISGDSVGEIVLWDFFTGRVIDDYAGHDGGVSALRFAPTDDNFVSGSWDNSIRLWDIGTKQVVRTFNGHTGGVNDIDVSEDNTYLVSGSYDMDVRLWDLSGYLELYRLPGDGSDVNEVVYSSDGEFVISAHDSSAVLLWNPVTGVLFRTLRGHTSATQDLAISDDNSTIAAVSNSGQLRVWRVSSGRQVLHLHDFESWIVDVVFDPDGETLMLVMGDRLRWYNLETGDIDREFMSETSIAAAALSGDGNRVLVASGTHIRMLDARTGEMLYDVQGHEDTLRAVALSHDGTMVLSGGFDNIVNLWDAETGELLHTFTGHVDRINGLAFSPNDEMFVSSSNDRSVRLWSIEAGIELYEYEGHTSRVTSVAFSPNGDRIVSGGQDDVILVWHLPHDLNSLVDWTLDNRYFYELSCSERSLYRVDPQCDENGELPPKPPEPGDENAAED